MEASLMSDTKSGVIVALITAAFTLTGIILKDLILKVLEERRTEKRMESAVYERYSIPLAASAISLMHRLHEILLTEGRPVFLISADILKGTGQGPAFWSYKKVSTLFRLASVAGWIRACRREFAHLRLAAEKENELIGIAIEVFERALADGTWIEAERVRRLCDIWHISSFLNAPGQRAVSLDALGIRVDNVIYKETEGAPNQDLSLLENNEKEKLCTIIANLLTEGLKTNPVDRLVISKTWPDAFSVVAMREAWIYRDWQAAIGDMMLRPTVGEPRKFEVIGYGEFEHMYEEGTHEQRRWVSRLSEIFDGVDLSIEDRFDARPRQLRAILRATAELVLALNRAQGVKTIVSNASIATANGVLDRVTADGKDVRSYVT
jgi:hypothetical protein